MNTRQNREHGSIWFLVIFLTGVSSAAAQVLPATRPRLSLASNVIMPQSAERAFTIDAGQRDVEITEVIADVDILDQLATTTIEIRLRNTTARRQEAELIMPVPDSALIRSFTYEGAGNEGQAAILPRDEARRIYDSLVAKIRDPALLEFIGYNMVRSSVFPVEAHGRQWVRLTYEHLMPVNDNRIDYILPRSESLEYKVPWQITCTIRASKDIATAYSSSHKLTITRQSNHEITVKIPSGTTDQPGSFRLSYLLEQNGITASMFSYPDPKFGGGYFLLLAGLPVDPSKDAPAEAIKREVTLVIDRSGSMNGEKIKQVREAALQILAGLNDGETFNIIIYSNTVEMFSPEPVEKNAQTEHAARSYIQNVRVTGGTNIHDALVESLRQKPSAGFLPIVLFLTDGLPTVGNTSEVAIREAVMKGNPYNRRVFTFGVGVDVNAPLLERVASETRGRATFVLPKEDVEVKVGQVFRQLAGPILADPQMDINTIKGTPALGRTLDIMPHKMPDLFEGDQVVLLGKYIGEEPLTFNIRGNYLGKPRTFTFTFDFTKATTKNGFVPRLWASRKIAELIDEVRQLGADGNTNTSDPRVRELVDEIVRLSTEFGILTEYTAFLAREGTDLADMPTIRREASDHLEARAMKSRSGFGGVNQSLNIMGQRDQSVLNIQNEYYDADMNRVSISTVQQINDRAYYRRGNRWVDSRLVSGESEVRPTKVIEFGTEEFFELAQRLARTNRQGSIALRGDILLEVDGEPILIRGLVR
ncbi:MAG: VWA domain-containing protein [Sedimentisphaerales bacterium]|nr:VWA domain-containing protein [Sedimentisphaerales bacterium]